MMRMKRPGARACVLTAGLFAWVLSGSAVSAKTYVVQSGDTLSEIADTYGLTTSDLATHNGLSNSNVVYAGQKIDIPMETASGVVDTVNYRIQPGDSLWDIASARQTTVDRLIAANPELMDPSFIRVGEVIQVPARASSSAVSASSPSKQSTKKLLDSYAREYGLEPALVEAVSWQESGWQQNVVSSAGAIGTMQVMPATGRWVSDNLVGDSLDISGSTDDNVHAGVAYLRYLIDHTDSLQHAIACYYQGLDNLHKYGVFPESQRYVDNVMALRAYIMVNGTPPGH